MSKHHGYYNDDTTSTTDEIHHICNGKNCDESDSTTTRDSIYKACHRYDRKENIESNHNTIANIREAHNDFNINPHHRKQNNIITNIHGRSEMSSSTINDIQVLCNDCNKCPSSNCESYNPGISNFNSVIVPVTNLSSQYSGVTGCVEFRMRRKNKTVTFQWEPFSGTMAANGVAFLTVMQSICNTPPYPMSMPIYIRYKDENRITNITIDPSAVTGNIKFYLNTDGTGNNINMGDAFYIYAGSVSWIVDGNC